MTPCKLWEGELHANGYGRIRCRRRQGEKDVLAHRQAYCDANGCTLESIKGLVVRHTCDNPPCVEPTHLLIGMHQDNTDDKIERGRMPRGEDRAMAKLTEEQVRWLRAVYVPRHREFGTRALARSLGVSQWVVSHAIRGLTWSHV